MKSLQKLSVAELSKQDKITVDQFNQLTPKQQKKLIDVAQEQYNTAERSCKEVVLFRYDLLFDTKAKNKLYEHNHRNILYAIDRETRKTGWIPSVTAIAEATDLSRQTVTKHLQGFRDSDLHNEQQAKLETMRFSVLGFLYKLSVQGNLRACKMFLDYSNGNTPQSVGTFIDKQQNNY
jgi:hypothetical protein